MQTISLAEAQRHLSELVHNPPADGEVVIVEANRPVARLVVMERTSLRNLQPSSVGAALRPYPSPADDLLTEMRAPNS